MYVRTQIRLKILCTIYSTSIYLYLLIDVFFVLSPVLKNNLLYQIFYHRDIILLLSLYIPIQNLFRPEVKG